MRLELWYKTFFFHLVLNIANKLQSRAASVGFEVQSLEEELAQKAKGSFDVDVEEVQWLKKK